MPPIYTDKDVADKLADRLSKRRGQTHTATPVAGGFVIMAPDQQPHPDLLPSPAGKKGKKPKPINKIGFPPDAKLAGKLDLGMLDLGKTLTSTQFQKLVKDAAGLSVGYNVGAGKSQMIKEAMKKIASNGPNVQQVPKGAKTYHLDTNFAGANFEEIEKKVLGLDLASGPDTTVVAVKMPGQPFKYMTHDSFKSVAMDAKMKGAEIKVLPLSDLLPKPEIGALPGLGHKGPSVQNMFLMAATALLPKAKIEYEYDYMQKQHLLAFHGLPGDMHAILKFNHEDVEDLGAPPMANLFKMVKYKMEAKGLIPVTLPGGEALKYEDPLVVHMNISDKATKELKGALASLGVAAGKATKAFVKASNTMIQSMNAELLSADIKQSFMDALFKNMNLTDPPFKVMFDGTELVGFSAPLKIVQPQFFGIMVDGKLRYLGKKSIKMHMIKKITAGEATVVEEKNGDYTVIGNVHLLGLIEEKVLKKNNMTGLIPTEDAITAHIGIG